MCIRDSLYLVAGGVKLLRLVLCCGKGFADRGLLDVYKRQVGHSGGQQVGADKVCRTVTGTLLVAAADITVLLAVLVLIPLLIQHMLSLIHI